MKDNNLKDTVLLTVCIMLLVGIVSISMVFMVRWREENPGKGGFIKGNLLSRFVEPKKDSVVCPTALPEYQAIMDGESAQKCTIDGN